MNEGNFICSWDIKIETVLMICSLNATQKNHTKVVFVSEILIVNRNMDQEKKSSNFPRDFFIKQVSQNLTFSLDLKSCLFSFIW